MRHLFLLSIASLIIGLFAASIISASSYVPISNSVYKFLDACQARSIISLKSTSMRPIKRLDTAELLLTIADRSSDLNDRVLLEELRYWIREFAHDIEIVKSRSDTIQNVRRIRFTNSHPSYEISTPHRHLFTKSSESSYIVVDPIFRLRMDVDDTESILRRTWGVSLRGSLKDFYGYYFRFTDSVERGKGKYSYRSDLLEDKYGYVGPLQGGKETYYDMTEAYITATLNEIDFVFGKDRISWGSSPRGGLYLSGIGPSFNQFRYSFSFFEKFRFMHVIGKLHPYKSPKEHLYTTPEGWVREVLAPKWMAAHRLEYSPSDKIVLGFGESVVWGERGLDLAYVNPLNFYFSAEHDGGDQDNALLWCDIKFRAANGWILYSEFLIDDLKTSSLGEGDPGNRLGIIVGSSISSLGLDGLDLRIEYTRLQPYLYSHFYPVNRYTTWSSSLGSDLEPNSDRVEIDINYNISRKFSMGSNIQTIRHGDRGGKILQSIPKDSEPVFFLDDSTTSWTMFDNHIEYEPYTAFIVGVGMINNDKSSFLPDRYYFHFGYRF